jgi:Zn-dependent peptidase ImmA (M78 family)
MKPNFDLAQNTATKLLLDQNINELFVDVRDFHLRDDIVIDTMQHYCSVTGISVSNLQLHAVQGALTIKKYGKSIVLYDDSIANSRRKHWGIVHELGHIYLGHEEDSRTFEIEAHFFAAQVVAPEIVIVELTLRNQGLSALELYNNFNISFEAAQKRLRTLRNRGCWSSGDIDHALLNKYKPFLARCFNGVQQQKMA